MRQRFSSAQPILESPLTIGHCKALKRIVNCAVVPFNVVRLVILQKYSTRARGLFFCFVFFALFALHRLVDDYKLGDVSVSLFAAPLRCACIHLRTFLVALKQFFVKAFL